jgi:ankyrin repeat protein
VEEDDGLAAAVRAGDVAAVRRRLGERPTAAGSASWKGVSARHVAAQLGAAEIVALVIDADPALLNATTWQGGTARLAMVRALIDAGVPASEATDSGWTVLHRLAQQGDDSDERIEAIEVLRAAGADPHAQDATGRTPAEIAEQLDAPRRLRDALRP